MEQEIVTALVGLCQEAIKFALKKIRVNGSWGKSKVDMGALALGAVWEKHIISDSEAEWGMVAVLHDFGRIHHICFIIRGEEVGDGILRVGDPSSSVIITVCMDGIDGTSNFVVDKPAGPMLAFAWGENPKYADFFVACIGNTLDASLVIGDTISNTVSLISSEGDVKVLPSISNLLFDTSKCVINTSTQICLDTASGGRDTHGGSTAYVAYSIVTQGFCWALLLDATRKLNLEQPAFYLLVTLAGGLYMTLEGESLADKLFLEWMRSPKLNSAEDGNQVLIGAFPNTEYLKYAQILYL